MLLVIISKLNSPTRKNRLGRANLKWKGGTSKVWPSSPIPAINLVLEGWIATARAVNIRWFHWKTRFLYPTEVNFYLETRAWKAWNSNLLNKIHEKPVVARLRITILSTSVTNNDWCKIKTAYCGEGTRSRRNLCIGAGFTWPNLGITTSCVVLKLILI